MFKLMLSALIAVGATAGSVAANATVSYEPIYVTDGQFTATLEQHSHRWLLQPLRGDEVEIVDHASDCGSRKPVPHGLWYVSRDAQGRPQLVAPSATELPDGYPSRVLLAACGDDAVADAVLRVPPVALHWINDFVGSVLIDD
jgi:hypothetical protein